MDENFVKGLSRLGKFKAADYFEPLKFNSMKQTSLTCLLLICVFLGKAQERVKSIDDLKYYMGYSTSQIENVAKEKGYVGYYKDDDEKKGKFVIKLFMGEEYDLIVYCKEDKVVGVGAEDVTPAEYKKMISYLKNNGFTKKILEIEAAGIGTERYDLWVNDNTKLKLRVRYDLNEKDTPIEIILTTGVKWGFE